LLLPDAWSSSQLVGSLVAALVAEQKSADQRVGLLRFVRSGSLERHESAIVGYRIDAEAARRVLAV
jgi:hypothetical protein